MVGMVGCRKPRLSRLRSLGTRAYDGMERPRLDGKDLDRLDRRDA